jgi:hypothetical protein
MKDIGFAQNTELHLKINEVRQQTLSQKDSSGTKRLKSVWRAFCRQLSRVQAFSDPCRISPFGMAIMIKTAILYINPRFKDVRLRSGGHPNGRVV